MNFMLLCVLKWKNSARSGKKQKNHQVLRPKINQMKIVQNFVGLPFPYFVKYENLILQYPLSCKTLIIFLTSKTRKLKLP